jgi:hypothetical protein
MSKRIVLGVFLGVVASAITASAVVVVVGQQDEGPPEETYIPPIKAREEWTPKTPPGTPVADLALPITYGRFHIVAPETDPGPYVQGPTPPPGVEKVGHDVKESASLDEFRGHDLFIEPPYIPAGWELVGTHAETVIWSDGSHTDSMFGLSYQRPQYFGIDIKRFLVAPDTTIRLVANPAAEMLYTLGEIRGVPVVYHRDLLQIHFVQGDVLTQIEAPVFDLDELIKIADALIAETEEGSS